MRTALVISPHADDAAAFCGGTLAKFAGEGWKVVLVRVTDDCRDSVGLTLEETKQRNADQLQDAARSLGVSEIVELGYETDCLADASEVELRGKIVYLFRKHRPYAVFSFDPFGLYEDNMDHVRVAQAVYEAFWVSAFDLHHPEHFREGLAPFSVCERWFFARELVKADHAEDVTDFIGPKIDAMNAHREMVRNMLNRFILQLRTWGRRSPLLESVKDGDPRGLLEAFLTEQAKAVAAEFKLAEGRLAEKFRLERFGDLEGLFQLFSEPIPGAPGPVRRDGLDPPPAG
ncbi:MAG TPA: PIG-L deacetylase family protein [bacterium]|nr:PIG-L deacetylase family protein [bacterium]